MSYRVCFSLSFLKCPAVEAASRGCALSFNNSSPEFADLSVFCDGGRVSLQHHYGGFLVPVCRCRTGRQICAGGFAFKSGGIRCANVPFFFFFCCVYEFFFLFFYCLVINFVFKRAEFRGLVNFLLFSIVCPCLFFLRCHFAIKEEKSDILCFLLLLLLLNGCPLQIFFFFNFFN